MRAHLTDIAVRALKPSGKQMKVWDTSTPGFGVIVGKSKSFFVMYGRQRTVKILGRFPDTPLAAARTAAKKLLVHTPADTASLTFAQTLDLFLNSHCESIRTRTKYDYQKALKRHFLPKLATKRLDEITTSEVTDIIDRLVKETPSEANHAFMYARTFFRWAQKRRYVVRSPLDGLSLPTKSTARARVLADAELKAIWESSEGCGQFGAIVKLLILTGQRRGEIAALRSDWIRNDTITLPQEITKNGRRHAFPIGATTSALISSVLSSGKKSHESSSVILFPARGSTSTPFSGWSKCKVDLDKACRVEGWTLHDLRRTFASNMGALGVRLEVIEKLLNHQSGSFAGVAGIYQRYDFFAEMKAAIELYDAHIRNLVSGEPR
jgi:integrase